jgi:hypothetical protein
MTIPINKPKEPIKKAFFKLFFHRLHSYIIKTTIIQIVLYALYIFLFAVKLIFPEAINIKPHQTLTPQFD